MQSTLTTPRVARWLVVSIAIISMLIIALWTAATPGHLHGKADAVGYAICHRIAERSFEAYGVQLPLCARCTGIYLGVMTGLFVYVASGRGRAMRLPPWKIAGVFAIFVGILAVDGINSYLHLFPGVKNGLYEPNNTLRLTTGIYTGLAMITLVLPIFNNTVWYRDDNRRVLESWHELAGLLLVTTLVLIATLTRRPLILLIFGLISAAGVVVILTMINSVMVITIFRLERRYRNLQEMWWPLLSGAALTFILIGTIDFLRFSITGTWDGFTFPTAYWGF